MKVIVKQKIETQRTNFGTAIRKLRNLLGLSQEEMARYA